MFASNLRINTGIWGTLTWNRMGLNHTTTIVKGIPNTQNLSKNILVSNDPPPNNVWVYRGLEPTHSVGEMGRGISNVFKLLCKFCIFPQISFHLWHPTSSGTPVAGTRVDHETVAIDVSRFVASLPWEDWESGSWRNDDNNEKKEKTQINLSNMGASWWKLKAFTNTCNPIIAIKTCISPTNRHAP